MNKPTIYLESKRHYEILDGLRGVAALAVVIFHCFEVFTFDNRFVQLMNHGYLAVDFFFLLSGFVIAYSYDDRWIKMTQWDFYKRRLIRLQPMVVMGSLIGAALFYFQPSPPFPLIAGTPVWKMLLVMIIGATLIPIPVSWDIRGWTEMHPLNGPAWSLFFEYVGNILYAVIVRRFSKVLLGIFVGLAAVFLVQFVVWGGQGDVIGGWAINGRQLHIGFARLLYPFFAGVLLCRMGKLIHIKWAFGVCSLMILAIFWVPRLGGAEHLWMNGVYESVCIIILFPLIVAIGAGGHINGKRAARFCKWLGDISYPLYITHYPLIYCFWAWVYKNKIPAAKGMPGVPSGEGMVGTLLLFVVAVSVAYACLKLYDEPVRAWLKAKWGRIAAK
jgi:peptidoglycan/LPS O-acetylase OafA/YrhL